MKKPRSTSVLQGFALCGHEGGTWEGCHGIILTPRQKSETEAQGIPRETGGRMQEGPQPKGLHAELRREAGGVIFPLCSVLLHIGTENSAGGMSKAQWRGFERSGPVAANHCDKTCVANRVTDLTHWLVAISLRLRSASDIIKRSPSMQTRRQI